MLALARDDLNAAKALLDVASVTGAIVGFHAQQAVEKALKSVLMHREVTFRYSHDLTYLTELLEAAEVSTPEALSGADRLSAYAVQLRYDEVPAEKIPRAEAIAIAAAAVAWAEAMLSGGRS